MRVVAPEATFVTTAEATSLADGAFSTADEIAPAVVFMVLIVAFAVAFSVSRENVSLLRLPLRLSGRYEPNVETSSETELSMSDMIGIVTVYRFAS